MSTVKEVKVTLSPQDEKGLSRTRRKRKSRVDAEEQVGGAEIDYGTEPVGAPLPSPITRTEPAPVPPSIPAAPIIPVQIVSHATEAPKASMSATSVVGGGDVKITAKKGTSTIPTISPVRSTLLRAAPKIVHSKKRISDAPAATNTTQKKQRLIVSQSSKIPYTTVQPIVATVKNSPRNHPSLPGKTRRFTERRISIEMRPAAATRKQRRRLKDRIAEMPITSVRKLLLSKGLIKLKSTMPPAEMMRSMLKDFLLLHTAD